ncbi:MAG: hypothetical protein WDA06_09580 [Phenylobacterium sp.]
MDKITIHRELMESEESGIYTLDVKRKDGNWVSVEKTANSASEIQDNYCCNDDIMDFLFTGFYEVDQDESDAEDAENAAKFRAFFDSLKDMSMEELKELYDEQESYLQDDGDECSQE